MAPWQPYFGSPVLQNLEFCDFYCQNCFYHFVIFTIQGLLAIIIVNWKYFSLSLLWVFDFSETYRNLRWGLFGLHVMIST